MPLSAQTRRRMEIWRSEIAALDNPSPPLLPTPQTRPQISLRPSSWPSGFRTLFTRSSDSESRPPQTDMYHHLSFLIERREQTIAIPGFPLNPPIPEVEHRSSSPPPRLSASPRATAAKNSTSQQQHPPSPATPNFPSSPEESLYGVDRIKAERANRMYRAQALLNKSSHKNLMAVPQDVSMPLPSPTALNVAA